MASDEKLNDIQLKDREVTTMKRLALNELHMVERMMASRSHQPNIHESQWWKDRANQCQNLRDILDALAFEEAPRTNAAG